LFWEITTNFLKGASRPLNPGPAFFERQRKLGERNLFRPPALARPPLSPLALAAERRLPPVADRKKITVSLGGFAQTILATTSQAC